MLGVFLIYFIGKKFYELAEKHLKKKWLFAVLGVIAYYFGTMLGGVFLALFEVILDENFIDWENNLLLGVIALPFGLLSTYGFYYLLNRKWSLANQKNIDSIEAIGNQEN